MPFPMDRTSVPVTVEYDELPKTCSQLGVDRRRREFPNQSAGRRFYERMAAQGRQPEVVKKEEVKSV